VPEKSKRLNPVDKKSSPCRYIAVSLRCCRPVLWVFCAVPVLVCLLSESFFNGPVVPYNSRVLCGCSSGSACLAGQSPLAETNRLRHVNCLLTCGVALALIFQQLLLFRCQGCSPC
jgi:hypothetical protein